MFASYRWCHKLLHILWFMREYVTSRRIRTIDASIPTAAAQSLAEVEHFFSLVPGRRRCHQQQEQQHDSVTRLRRYLKYFFKKMSPSPPGWKPRLRVTCSCLVPSPVRAGSLELFYGDVSFWVSTVKKIIRRKVLGQIIYSTICLYTKKLKSQTNKKLLRNVVPPRDERNSFHSR